MNTRNRLNMKNARRPGLFVFTRFNLLFLFKTHMVTDSLLSLCSTARWTQIPSLSTSCTLSGTLSLRWEKPLSVHTFRLGYCGWPHKSAVLWHVKRFLFTFCFFFCPSLSQQFLPTWLAPNLITFTGFMFLVLNFLMLAFYDFDFTASGMSPSLLYCPLYLLNEWMLSDHFSHSRPCSTIKSLPLVKHTERKTKILMLVTWRVKGKVHHSLNQDCPQWLRVITHPLRLRETQRATTTCTEHQQRATVSQHTRHFLAQFDDV